MLQNVLSSDENEIHHLGYACRNLKDSIRYIYENYNVKNISDIFYDPYQDASVCIFEIIDHPRIELVEGNAVRNILKTDLDFYHICYEVEKLEHVIDEYLKKGAVLISSPKPAVLFNNRKVAFVHINDKLIELLERKESIYEINSTSIFVNLMSNFVIDELTDKCNSVLKSIGINCFVSQLPYDQVIQSVLQKGNDQFRQRELNFIFIRLQDLLIDSNKAFQYIDDLAGAISEKASASNDKWHILFMPENDKDKKIIFNEVINQFKKVIDGCENVSCIDLSHDIQISKIDHSLNLETNIANIPYSTEFFNELSFRVALLAVNYHIEKIKHIVVDADNTLWSGICAEDGADNVKIHEHNKELQLFLGKKINDGVLISVCSKNIEDDVLSVFRKNKSMLLNDKSITDFKINWEPKSSNILHMAQLLNIGVDSFLVIDDSDVECEEISTKIPQCQVIRFPLEAEKCLKVLSLLSYLNFGKSTISKQRGEFYKKNVLREKERDTSQNIFEFIKRLGVEVTISNSIQNEYERLIELSYRVNQFRSTQLTLSQKTINNLLNNGCQINSVYVKDKYGDYGLVGCLIYQIDKATLLVNNLLISCRALGRGVEHKIIQKLGEAAQISHIENIHIQFEESTRNIPAKLFFESISEQCEINNNLTIYKTKTSNAFSTKFEDLLYSVSKTKINDHVNIQNKDGHINKNFVGRLINAYIENIKTNEQRLAANSNLSDIPSVICQLWSEFLNVSNCEQGVSFFSYGGSSLTAVRLIAAIKKRYDVNISFGEFYENPTIEKFTHLVISKVNKSCQISENNNSIIDKHSSSELTHAQLRVLQSITLYGNADAFNMPLSFRVKGQLDVEKIFLSLNEIIKKHKIFRTIFHRGDGLYSREIYAPEKCIYKVEVIETPKDKLEYYLANDAMFHFDLSKWPLFIFRLYKLEDDVFYISFVIHHLIFDGGSFEIFFRELSNYYFEELNPNKQLDYDEYIKYENTYVGSNKYIENFSYWTDKLNTVKKWSNITPLNYYPSLKSFHTHTINIKHASNVLHLSKEVSVSRFVIYKFIFDLALYYHTGFKNILSAIPVTLRIDESYQNTIGFFVNLIYSYHAIPLDEKIDESIKRLQKEMFLDLEHLSLPSDLINKHMSAHMIPYFDTVFIYQDALHKNSSLRTFHCSDYRYDHPGLRAPFTFEIYDDGETSQLFIKADSSLLSKVDIINMANNFDALLSLLPKCFDQNVQYLIDELEKSSIQSMSIVSLFNQAVEKYPEKIAVYSSDGDSISYSDLNKLSNKIANALINNSYTSNIELVAVLLQRSIDYYATIIGILKSGKAFLSLSTEYPIERLNQIAAAADLRLTVTSESNIDKKMNIGLMLNIDELKNYPLTASHKFKNIKPNDLAYVIFTSGSTGVPKGVAIEHAGVLNTIQTTSIALGITSQDKIFQFSALTFDGSIWEWATALCNGCGLFFVSGDSRRSVAYLYDHDCDVTIAGIPPTIATQLSPANFKSLRILTLPGEPLNPVVISRWKDHVSLWNVYGPTEGSIAATMIKINNNASIRNIGNPLDGVKVYILDENLNAVEEGKVGEICLAGICLARGYYKDPQRTIESFVHHPMTNERLYRTGDLGSFSHNGTIEYFGRRDNQIKIRGYRVELEEIEKAIYEYPNVEHCIVDVNKENSTLKAVIAYDNSKNLTLDQYSELERNIAEFLSNKLPSYMLPAKIEFVGKVEVNENFKLDRKMVFKEKSIDREDRITSDLLHIWSTILNKPVKNVKVSFFDLGGHSLLGLQLVTKINNQFKLDLPTSILFEYQTVESQVLLIRSKLNNNATNDNVLPILSIDAVNRYEAFPLTDIQYAYWIGRESFYKFGNIGVHGYEEYDCYDLDIERLEKSWNRLINRHESLRIVFLNSGLQQILEKVPFFKFKIINTIDKASYEQQILALREHLSHQVFDPSQWPLFDIQLVKYGKNYRLIISVDGLILDGWSYRLILKEWNTLYSTPKILPEVTLSFRDYVLNLVEYKKTDLFRKHEKYWLNRIESFPDPLILPMNKNISSDFRPKFSRVSNVFSKNNWSKLKDYLRRCSLSPTCFIIGLIAETMRRWSNQDHFALSLTLFNRVPLHNEINAIAGDFTTLGLLEIDFKSLLNATFLDRISAIQERLHSDLSNYLYSGIQFLRTLREFKEKDVIYDVVITSLLDMEAIPETSFLKKLIYSITQTPQILLDIKVYEIEGYLKIDWDFAEDIFDVNFINTSFNEFSDILNIILKDGGISSLNQKDFFISKNHKLYSLETSNYSYEYLLNSLVDDAIIKFNKKVAIETDTRKITYQQLDYYSNCAAQKMIDSGVKPGDVVCIYLNKSINQIIASLAILKAGGIFLPMDSHSFPLERIKTILSDGEVKYILTDDRGEIDMEVLLSTHDHLFVINLSHCFLLDAPIQDTDQKFEPIRSPSDLAYIIYTSGSTGKPKGVAIEHRSIVNTLLDINQRLGITEQDKSLMISSFSFDLAIYDIYGMLIAGGSVYVPDAEQDRDPEYIYSILNDKNITLWNSVPKLFEMVISHLENKKDNIFFSRLRNILLSGDWVSVTLPKRITKFVSDTAKIFSLGGATEGSIWSIIYPINLLDHESQIIPYGKELTNQKVIIANSSYTVCPVGVIGDIYIGGIGLAREYYKDIIKTQEAFINHPLTYERLYKTGDLGRYLPDGNIEFIGRKDTQVKIGGYRVELKEIDSIIQSFSFVKSSITLDEKDKENNAYLISYLTVSDANKEKEKPNITFTFKEDGNEVALDREHLKASRNLAIQRKSYRNYLPHIISNEAIINLFRSLKINTLEAGLLQNINIENLAKLLAPFASFQLDNDIKKFCYPSASATYAVQINILINDAEKTSCYYFDRENFLLKEMSSNYIRNANDEIGVFIILSGKNGDLDPLYFDLSNTLLKLEAGYMEGLLYHSIANDRYSCVRIDQESTLDSLQERVFPLHERSVITAYKFGSDIEKNIIQSLGINIFIWPLVGNFSNKDDQLLPFSYDVRRMSLEDITLLKDSSYLILFMSDTEPTVSTYLDVGHACEKLMIKGQKELIGFCPIGGFSKKVLNDFTHLTKNKYFIHALTVGAISLEHRESRELNLSNQSIESIMQAHLHRYLPDYMIPKYLMVLDDLPLTKNDKINRKLLPRITLFDDKKPVLFSDLEERVRKIWIDILGRDINVKNTSFFVCGGNSLTAVSLVNRLNNAFQLTLRIRDIYENTSIESQAALVNTNASSFVDNKKHISSVKYLDALPLLPQQQHILTVNSFKIHSRTYNIPLVMELTGAVDIARLSNAIKEVVSKYDVLRLKLTEINNEIFQVTDDEFNYQLNEFDLSNNAHENVLELIKERVAKPIDLYCASEKFFIYKLSSNKYVLLILLHHIFMDGNSIFLILKDLFSFYDNHSNPLRQDCKYEFLNYVNWYLDEFKNEYESKCKPFWLNYLKNYKNTLRFPDEICQIKQDSSEGSTLFVRIDNNLDSKLKQFTQSYEVSLFELLISVYSMMLHLYCNNEDIVIAYPDSRTSVSYKENIAGYLAETLLLRSQLDTNINFKEYLRYVQTSLLNINEHHYLHISDVIKNLSLEKQQGTIPFPVLFSYQTHFYDDFKSNDFEVKLTHVRNPVSKVKLTLTVYPDPEGHLFEFEYNKSIFTSEQINSMAVFYKHLLNELILNSDQPLRNINPLPKEQKNKILQVFNCTEAMLPNISSLAQFVKNQSKANPQNIALMSEGINVTYEELDRLTDQIAHLLHEYGISENARIALLVNRSVYMVMMTVAIHKCGAAYIPIDPEFPIERVEYILNDAKPHLLIKDKNIVSPELSVQSIDIDTLVSKAKKVKTRQSSKYKKNEIACIIYTSGSTGNPKGVVCTHIGYINRILWMQKAYNASQDTVFVQKTPYCFDVSIWEIYWPLMIGAKLCIPKYDDHRNLDALIRLINIFQINYIHFVPSMLRAFVDYEGFSKTKTLQKIFSSGEVLPTSVYRRLKEQTHAKIYNLYGPTEASIDVTASEASDDYLNRTAIPIGIPIDNTKIYIIDSNMNLVPIGVVGEICIASIGLATGYLGKENLTKERFISNPFDKNEPYKTLYKTGDLGRYLPNGSIEYIGRKDNQIKLKGYRIELDEIESAICQLTDIKECAVHLNISNDILVATVTSNPGLNSQGIKKHLKSKLPAYMIPQVVNFVNVIPKLVSGKIDRTKIKTQYELSCKTILLEDNKKDILNSIISSVQGALKISNVLPENNFFEVGGDSINVLKVITILKKIGISLSIEDFFQTINFKDLSEKAKLSDKEAVYYQSNNDKGELYDPSSLQLGMIFHSLRDEKDSTYKDIFSYIIEGEFDEERFRKVLSFLFKKYQVLRSNYIYKDGNIKIIISPDSNYDLNLYENNRSVDIGSVIDAWQNEEKNRPIKILKSPLLRFSIHKFKENLFHFGLTFHHSLMDGWSVSIFIHELLMIYDDKAFEFKEDTFDFVKYYDLALIEKSSIQNPTTQSFWIEYLDGYKKIQLVKSKDTLSAVASTNKKIYFSFSHLDNEIYRVAKDKKLHVKTLLLSTIILPIAKLANTNDVTLGYLLNERPEIQGDTLLGLFLNVLPLRYQIDPKENVYRFMEKVFKHECELIQYRTFPLHSVQKISGYKDITDFVFSYTDLRNYSKLDNCKNIKLISGRAYEKTNFDLSINFFVDREQHLSLEVEFNSKIYTEDFINYLHKLILIVIKSIISCNEKSHTIQDVFDKLSANDITYEKVAAEYLE